MEYYPSPFLKSAYVCQLCGITSASRMVLPCPPQALLHREPPPGSDQPICGPCYAEWRKENGIYLPPPMAPDPATDIEALVSKWLRGIGLGADEINAKVDLIPGSVLDAIPNLTLKCLFAGLLRKVQGFGLCSRPGYGKSQAIAALVRAALTQSAQNNIYFTRLPTEATKVVWMNVFLTIQRWRLDGINPRIPGELERARNASLLVLDDLGREINRSGVGQDVATGHLDAILTHRDRENLPTIWTSNLSEEEIIDRYGTPFYRRLTRLNPGTWIE